MIWFLTAGPVVGIPLILAEFPERKNCGCIFEKHNRHEQVQFFDIFSGFFSGLHLAVGRHRRRRVPRYPHGLQFSRVKVFLTDLVHTCYGLYHKLSFLWFYGGCGRHNPLNGRRIECSLVFLFEFVNVFWQDSMPCFGRIAGVLQSLLEICPQISSA